MTNWNNPDGLVVKFSNEESNPLSTEIPSLFVDFTEPASMWSDKDLPVGNYPVSNIRWRGRIMAGGGALWPYNRVGAGGSWLPDDAAGARYIPRDAQILGMSEVGMIGIAGCTKSSNSGVESADPIGVAGLAISDKDGNNVWAGYFETQIDAAPPGEHHYGIGIEIDVKNKGNNVIQDAYQIAGGSGGVGLWLAAGAANSFGGTAANPSCAAIALTYSASTWNTGIIFRDGSLTSIGGVYYAINMAKNMVIDWQSAADVLGARIFSSVATSGKDVWLKFADNKISVFGTTGAKEMFIVQKVSDNSVNYFAMNVQDSGTGPSLLAAGDDTDITPNIRGKGTGGINIQSGDGVNKFRSNSTGIGFFNTAPVAKPTVSGAKGGNAALGSLMTALANLGLVTDSTSA